MVYSGEFNKQDQQIHLTMACVTGKYSSYFMDSQSSSKVFLYRIEKFITFGKQWCFDITDDC